MTDNIKNMRRALLALTNTEKRELEESVGISVTDLLDITDTAKDLSSRIEEVKDDIKTSGYSMGTMFTGIATTGTALLFMLGSPAAPIFLVGAVGAGMATFLTKQDANRIKKKLGID